MMLRALPAVRAMTVDWFRRAALPLLLIWILGMGLLYGIQWVHPESNRNAGQQAIFSFFLAVGFWGVCMPIVALQCDREALQQRCRLQWSRYLFTLPVSTPLMVVVHFAAGCIAAAAMSAAMVMSVNLVLDWYWPFYPTVGVTLVGVAVAQTVAWALPGRTVLQLIALIGAYIGVLQWITPRQPELPSPSYSWLQLTWTDGLLGAVVILVCLVVAIIGVARDRSARHWTPLSWSLSGTYREPVVGPSRSAEWHQFRWELYRIGVRWYVVIPLVMGPVSLLLVTLAQRSGWWSVSAGLVGMSLSLTATLMVQASIATFGMLVSSRPRGEFTCALPLSDRALGRAALQAVAVSATVCTAVAGTCLGAAYLWQHASIPDTPPLRGSLQSVVLVLSNCWLACWALPGLLPLLRWVVSRYPRRFGLGLFALLSYLALMFSLAVTEAPESSLALRIVWESLVGSMGVVCLALSAIVFLQALRRGLFGWKGSLAGLLFFAVVCAIHAWCWGSTSGRLDPPVFVLVVGILVLTTTPLAALPLTIARDRHELGSSPTPPSV